MLAINKLAVGQELWSLTTQKMGHTTMRTKSQHRVVITGIDPDPDPKWFMASWNGNPPTKYHAVLKSWKLKKVILVTSLMGRQRTLYRDEQLSLKQAIADAKRAVTMPEPWSSAQVIMRKCQSGVTFATVGPPYAKEPGDQLIHSIAIDPERPKKFTILDHYR